MKVVHIERDIHYLPKPNEVEVVFSNEASHPGLTATAFMIPVFEDGTLLLAQNQNRGLEVAGGHVEAEETLREAAIRECLEEVGCTVTDVVPIGYLRMTVGAEVPADYRYPHPVSYQQFFAGRVREVKPYEANAECAEPQRVDLTTSARQQLSPSAFLFCAEARSVMAKRPPSEG